MEEELKKYPQAGPKKLTIEEYKKRQEGRPQKDTPHPPEKKKRAGKQVKLRQDLANLHRLAVLAVTKEEKIKFLQEINRLKELRRQDRKDRKQYQRTQYGLVR